MESVKEYSVKEFKETVTESQDWSDQVEDEDSEDSKEAFVEELISQIKIMKALEEDADKDMEREISERKKVIEMLGHGKKFYDDLYKEVEIVATAYSIFGHRVKNVAVKLAEQREGADSPL